MQITFEGEDLQHVVASIGDFLNDLAKHNLSVDTDPVDETQPEPTKKLKRRSCRGSSAEPSTADAKTDAGEGSRSQGSDDPPTPRRRRARTSSADATEKGVRGRRRKANSASPSDELKDTDLSKAASALADATNPKVVLDLLEEFGVAKVGELEGDARREFVKAAAEIAADA